MGPDPAPAAGLGLLARGAVSEATADADLMAAIASGDDLALGRLYDRHAPLLYGIALRITGAPAVAEEVVSDSFLRAWKNASSYRAERGDVTTWLVAITRNAALDQRRRGAARAGETDLTERLEAPAGEDPEARVDVLSALRDLPPDQRSVLELAYFSGVPQREIARRLGLPLGTVKSLTRRGLEALRRGGALAP